MKDCVYDRQIWNFDKGDRRKIPGAGPGMDWKNIFELVSEDGSWICSLYQ